MMTGQFEAVGSSVFQEVGSGVGIEPAEGPAEAAMAPPAEEVAGMGGIWGYDDYSAVASCLWDDSDPFLFDL